MSDLIVYTFRGPHSTTNGKDHFMENKDDLRAVAYHEPDHDSFYLKVDQNGFLIDSIIGINDRRTPYNHPHFRWAQVDQNTFEMYLGYLRSNNRAFYNSAQHSLTSTFLYRSNHA